MKLVFLCPRCSNAAGCLIESGTESVTCPHCDWERDLPQDFASSEQPKQCLVCGCTDLWRQKDFPQRLGLLMVALGAVLSTIAWYYHRPLIAIGILMAFALVDLVLFALMRDMLVCYRCRARHRNTALDEEHPAFNLEVAERYRQEEIRMRQES